MSDIKAGDIVKLKSGGVLMTVEWVNDDQAYCVWQEGAKPVSHVYNPVVLQKYDAEAEAKKRSELMKRSEL